MPKMTFEGNLVDQISVMTHVFAGAYTRNAGTSIAFANTGLNGVVIVGSFFQVPETGPHMVTGTIKTLNFSEITFPGAVINSLLKFENMTVKAEQVFSLIEHQEGRNVGEFDVGGLRSYLNGQDWTIAGSSGDDQVEVRAQLKLQGDDRLLGKSGDDHLEAGRGDDLIDGGKGLDQMFGQKGADIIKGRGGDDTARGGDGADKIFGGDGNDALWGDGGNDLLRGGRGQDVVSGGQGVDVINGGGGRDILKGGAGADRFVFTKKHGQDVIRDFQNNVDMLEFDRPGQVVVQATEDGALLTHADGSVLLEGVAAVAVSLSDGLWS